jgi:hypothetical protein
VRRGQAIARERVSVEDQDLVALACKEHRKGASGAPGAYDYDVIQESSPALRLGSSQPIIRG